MSPAHPVRRAAHPQRRLGDAEWFRWILRPVATQRDQLRERISQLLREPADGALHLLRRIGVVACGHRRVRREDGALAGRVEREPERFACAEPLGRELERGQRRVTFVQVDQAWLDSECPQRTDPAHAEQHVLRQTGVRVGFIQPCSDPALEWTVLGNVRVEQEQRYPSHLHTPDPRGDVRVVDREHDRQRSLSLVADQRRRQPLRVGVDPVLVLPTARVDPLAKVALAIHQSDRHQRHRGVRGFLEQVARQRAEAARVDGQ